jgi:hypothetical protein
MRSRSLLRVETRIVLMQHVRLRAFVFHISHPFRDLCCQICFLQGTIISHIAILTTLHMASSSQTLHI